MKIPMLSSYLMVKADSDPRRCRPWPHSTVSLVAQSCRQDKSGLLPLPMLWSWLGCVPSQGLSLLSTSLNGAVSALVSRPIKFSPGSCLGSHPSFPEKLYVLFPYHVVVLPYPILGQRINLSQPHFSIGKMGWPQYLLLGGRLFFYLKMSFLMHNWVVYLSGEYGRENKNFYSIAQEELMMRGARRG